MAEREGFEPSMGFKAHTPLAGERLRPLGHLSVLLALIIRILENKSNINYPRFNNCLSFKQQTYYYSINGMNVSNTVKKQIKKRA